MVVVGSKKSGKTTTTENLTRELTKRGYNVAAIKHVSEQDFTIDTVGKDTWRFAKAGNKLFQGETGEYFKKIMKEKELLLEPGEKTRISKEIGW